MFFWFVFGVVIFLILLLFCVCGVLYGIGGLCGFDFFWLCEI